MKVTFSSWPHGRSLSTPPCSHRSTSTSRIIDEAGVATGHDLLGLDPQQLGEHLAQLLDALEPAVVAGVDAGRVLDAPGQREQVVGQVELGRRGLAAREVERQAARLRARHTPAAAPAAKASSSCAERSARGVVAWRSARSRRPCSQSPGMPRSRRPQPGHRPRWPRERVRVRRRASRMLAPRLTSTMLPACPRADGSRARSAAGTRRPRDEFRRAVAQLVELRSPKPAVGGSSPSCPAQQNLSTGPGQHRHTSVKAEAS